MAYDIIQSILEQNDADMGAAEAHGVAVGMLCVDFRSEAGNWLNELFKDPISLLEEAKSQLSVIFAQTQNLLIEDNEFAFDLLLPDDDSDLSEQAEALRTWCQGFLFGVGYNKTDALWPGDCQEIIQDIVEITKMETNIDSEDDENNLVEIHEYLRAAVLLVRDQLNDLTPPDTRH